MPILVFVVHAPRAFRRSTSCRSRWRPPSGASCSPRCPASWTHHRHGAVRLGHRQADLRWGFSIGTFRGTWLAARLSTTALKVFFACFLYYVAATDAQQFQAQAEPPAARGGRHDGVGGVIGVVSSLVGIGGGALSIPFMMWCNVPVHTRHRHLGGDRLSHRGCRHPGLHRQRVVRCRTCRRRTLGYLYLPALFGIACFSFFTAPFGARLAHKTPVVTLKRVYAVFLIVDRHPDHLGRSLAVEKQCRFRSRWPPSALEVAKHAPALLGVLTLNSEP
ncbi:MAG: sulfite exporter TauE/SafE family protein [Desulfomicrobium escambiense]|nr:sulfite exporter TauE/SafE family protein [Desulfomicrobium escambiense]